MNGGGPEREGDTESEAGSRLWAVSTEPNVGLKLTNREIMTWAEVGRLNDWATQAPLFFKIFKQSLYSTWGSNLQPRDQKSHTSLAEPAKCLIVLILIRNISMMDFIGKVKYPVNKRWN